MLPEDERNGLSELCKTGAVTGCETCVSRENEMATFRRTERAMVRAMCGVKRMERKRTEDLTLGDVGIEGNSGSGGKGEWSEMVWACVE